MRRPLLLQEFRYDLILLEHNTMPAHVWIIPLSTVLADYYYPIQVRCERTIFGQQ